MEGLSLSSPDAEESLLACMLKSHTAVLSVLQQGLRREDFGYDQHARVFDAIMTIVDAGANVDAITVASQLEANGQLDLIGGKLVLDRIEATAPDPNHVMDYVQIVRDRSIRRMIRESCEGIMHDLHSEPDIRTVITQAENRVFRASDALMGTVSRGMDAKALAEMWRNRPVTGGPRIPFAFPTENKRNTGRPVGALTITAGYTSDGKTTNLIQEAVNVCGLGIPMRIHSLEMPEDELMSKIIGQLTGIESSRVELNDTTMEEGLRIDQAVDTIERWPLEIVADSSTTPAEVRAMQMRRPVPMVGIDYLQRFDFKEYAEIPRIAKMFKNLALDTKSCIDLLSQLNQPQAGWGQNPFPRPTEANLFGGKATGHEANIIRMIWSHRKQADTTSEYSDDGGWVRTGTGELIVAKFRGGQAHFSIPIYFDQNHVAWYERKPTARQEIGQTTLPVEG